MNRVLSWQCLGSDGDPPMTIIFVRDETAQNQFDLDSTQDAIGVPFESLQISGFVEDPKNPGLVQGMFILRFHTRGDSKDQSCLHSMITWFGDFDAETPWRILGFQSGLGPQKGAVVRVYNLVIDAAAKSSSMLPAECSHKRQRVRSC